MEMATSLAREKGIDINSDLKKQGMRSDRTVVIKKILMDMPKNIIVTTVSEFGEIKSIKIQLIGMWQKTVVKFAELDQANLDQFRALLFTLLVGTTAHDLGTLLEKAGKKTCVINRSLGTGNRICCAVVGFESDNDLEFAFCMELILGSKCGKFGYSALECDTPVAPTFKSLKKTFIRIVSNEHHLQLAKLYEKKSVSIFHSAAFDGKSWAQMVLFADSSDGLYFASGSGSFLSGTSGLNNGIPPVLQHGIDATSFNFPPKVSAILIAAKEDLVVDVVMDNSELVLLFPLSTFPSILTLDLSSSKVLTTKVGCLESKLVALKVFISSVLAKLELICAGSSSLAFFSSQ
ncbi:hypothetical protein G9A89_009592 [Geosiphon pyriformis]|nr:hypothetical protein G9A89_009592 [Geosiphon pyriformis]